MRRKYMIITGLAAIAGVTYTAGKLAKAVDGMKRHWFAQGYGAGHFVGFMDGGLAMANKYDETLKAASELCENHSILAEKYNDLCEEYDELERDYSELCEKFAEENRDE